MSRRVWFVALSAGLFAAAVTAQEQRRDKPSDDANFVGTYTVVSAERDGKSLPDDRTVGMVFTFEKDRVKGVDKDKKEFLDATYTIETASRPWVIRFKATLPKATESTGLIEKDKETVRLIYALPDGATPGEFKTKPRQLMVTLRVAGAKSVVPTTPDKK